MTDIAVSVIALPSLQMLDDVVVCSEGAAATVGCLCSMWSRVFSIARNRFSKLVVPRMPTCNCGPSGRIASNHHAHDGPSGRRDQSSSVSGMRPNTRWISDFWEIGTVSHHLRPFARTCDVMGTRMVNRRNYNCTLISSILYYIKNKICFYLFSNLVSQIKIKMQIKQKNFEKLK